MVKGFGCLGFRAVGLTHEGIGGLVILGERRNSDYELTKIHVGALEDESCP